MAIVEKQNYISNTLRKNRIEAYELDIEKVYLKYQ